MKNSKARRITVMALMLAICLAAQYFKSISQFITGPIVNATLIIAVLAAGLAGGLALSVLSPLCAMLLGFAPIMQVMPQMAAAVALGNASLVVCVWLLGKKHLVVGLAAGSVVKAALLWALVSLLIIPAFGSALPEAQKLAVKAMFSVNQLITAAIGSVLAYLINMKLKFTRG